MKRLVTEISTLLSGDSKKVLSFNKDFTYGDLKKILDRVLHNQEILA